MMIISNLKINHLNTPMGHDISKPSFSFQIEDSTGYFLKTARIRVFSSMDMLYTLYDSGMRTDISPLGFTPDYHFEGGRRYFWNVSAEADDGDTGTSAVSWFEGGRKEKNWDIPWIGSPFSKDIHPVFNKCFDLDRMDIISARLYITGLGLYEVYINDKKAGDEYLTPYFSDYRYWIQYSTFDVTTQLHKGENKISVMLGNGWYKGRFGYMGRGDEMEIYGDHFLLSAELVIAFKDNIFIKVRTDNSWFCAKSPILQSNIYDGEIYNANIDIQRMDDTLPAVIIKAPEGKVVERMSPPLRIQESIVPQKLIITPKNEKVLDFGQILTGWVEFDCITENKIYLQYGEVLQDDCFYRDNLRTAKAEFTYHSNGKTEHVRPHFTYYGFRYVKVDGIDLTDDNLSHYNFKACIIHSDMERTGYIETSNQKINRLIENTIWGQRGNFLDIPTDCPQRDERMGWTGDAQVFCATASYHANTAAFYRKYMRDMLYEQRSNEGAVPHVVPDVLTIVKRRYYGYDQSFNARWGEAASCAWGDAATIIPWTIYIYYGNISLLAENYENMKLWIDFIINIDENHSEGKRLWDKGFHFADWLALDNSDVSSCFGKTDPYYVASVYYMYSAQLTAKAAHVLGKKSDAEYYSRIADEVCNAIRDRYLSSGGEVVVDTQTALVLAIYFNIIPEKLREKTAASLIRKLEAGNMHLDTGFVGTAYLCKALTKAGRTREAYTLLLNENYPGWLYEINMGATTIWERWNSILPDGRISDTGMNSLNHYAYGAVAEWIYGTVCGIKPDENIPGFKKAIIAPEPDRRLSYVKGEYHSVSGIYRSSWEYQEDNVVFHVTIPFNCEACFIVPAGLDLITVNGEVNTKRELCLSKGKYSILTKVHMK